MPKLTFKLINKHLSFNVSESTLYEFSELRFELMFGARERLESKDGEIVKTGYAEFTRDNPRFNTSQLHFNRSWLDPVTNEEHPPGVSFYADLNRKVFKQLSKFNHRVGVTLTIDTTDFVGPISYGNDDEGYAKIWDVEKENPVVPESYEFVFSDETIC